MLKKIIKKTYLLIIGSATALIAIVSFTDSVEKVISYYSKIKTTEINFSVFTDNNFNDLFSMQDEILKEKEDERDYSELNSRLKKILSNNKELSDDLNKYLDENNELTILKQKGTVIASTTNQYKSKGFALFFDQKSGSLIYQDTDFGHGINGVKVINAPDNSALSFIAIKYITITGTGTFGESIKIYAISNHDITLALQKPYYEMNSGWHAFQSDTIELKSKNEIELKDSNLYLVTTGIAIYGDKKNDFSKLPTEIYLWNSKDLLFEQVKGRTTSDKGLMTDIYSDFAKPAGDWFTKPSSIDKTKILASFADEKW
ncbi:hypothetical protein ACEUEC_11550 [Aeromonas veronii]